MLQYVKNIIERVKVSIMLLYRNSKCCLYIVHFDATQVLYIWCLYGSSSIELLDGSPT